MTGADWSLRLARPGDAAAMPEIERAAAIAFAADPGLAAAELSCTRTRTEHDFARLIRKGHCLVAHVGTAMAGFLAAEPFRRELHIWEMDVAPAFQRRRIGSGLVRAAQIDARNTGFRALTLTTFRDVAWNAPFYARLGFEEIAEAEADAHPRLSDALTSEAAAGLPAERRCAMICFLD